ncbi:IclR family transcriptional regulator [Streptomyces sp. Amel2xB2]|uniref:IclR family transcriptional regulator n=1 Tax=Streptomyces sp. Amel2xB2 TaxID=1305829 RepID=UPI000DB9F782|nr:IclR family transcriptional regulator [Streptomyces sp. Amel2xB2]RAJ60038.1 IclR family transcriptional regulator [Streptomyces sp. Amel2xB2]
MARTIQSLERAAAVLRLLAGGERRLGLSDIASSMDLPKATAHGLLRTLQQEGFVEQDEATGKYQLGAELLRLGTSYLDVHELRSRALVWADDLARSSGESVYLGVLHQQGVLIVHHVFRPDNSRQVLEVGAMQPLHSTALGKVLSAFDPVAHSEAVDGERQAFTERTVTSLDGFEEVLEIVQARGWAADVEETWEGLASIAAPIRDRRGMPVGAVGVTGAVERLCEDVTSAPLGVGAATASGSAVASGAAGGPVTAPAEAELRPLLVAAVRDCARAVSRDLGARRF